MKKILTMLVGMLLAVPLAQAQTETGTSAGQQALDEARSGAISAARAGRGGFEAPGALRTSRMPKSWCQ